MCLMRPRYQAANTEEQTQAARFANLYRDLKLSIFLQFLLLPPFPLLLLIGRGSGRQLVARGRGSWRGVRTPKR